MQSRDGVGECARLQRPASTTFAKIISLLRAKVKGAISSSDFVFNYIKKESKMKEGNSRLHAGAPHRCDDGRACEIPSDWCAGPGVPAGSPAGAGGGNQPWSDGKVRATAAADFHSRRAAPDGGSSHGTPRGGRGRVRGLPGDRGRRLALSSVPGSITVAISRYPHSYSDPAAAIDSASGPTLYLQSLSSSGVSAVAGTAGRCSDMRWMIVGLPRLAVPMKGQSETVYRYSNRCGGGWTISRTISSGSRK